MFHIKLLLMSDEAKTWENSIGKEICTRKKAVQDIYMMEHGEIFCLSEASPHELCFIPYYRVTNKYRAKP